MENPRPNGGPRPKLRGDSSPVPTSDASFGDATATAKARAGAGPDDLRKGYTALGRFDAKSDPVNEA